MNHGSQLFTCTVYKITSRVRGKRCHFRRVRSYHSGWPYGLGARASAQFFTLATIASAKRGIFSGGLLDHDMFRLFSYVGEIGMMGNQDGTGSDEVCHGFRKGFRLGLDAEERTGRDD